MSSLQRGSDVSDVSSASDEDIEEQEEPGSKRKRGGTRYTNKALAQFWQEISEEAKQNYISLNPTTTHPYLESLEDNSLKKFFYYTLERLGVNNYVNILHRDQANEQPIHFIISNGNECRSAFDVIFLPETFRFFRDSIAITKHHKVGANKKWRELGWRIYTHDGPDPHYTSSLYPRHMKYKTHRIDPNSFGETGRQFKFYLPGQPRHTLTRAILFLPGREDKLTEQYLAILQRRKTTTPARGGNLPGLRLSDSRSPAAMRSGPLQNNVFDEMNMDFGEIYSSDGTVSSTDGEDDDDDDDDDHGRMTLAQWRQNKTDQLRKRQQEDARKWLEEKFSRSGSGI